MFIYYLYYLRTILPKNNLQVIWFEKIFDLAEHFIEQPTYTLYDSFALNSSAWKLID